jgi:16S rRNA (cytosine967-C5)-methyltransferase
LPEENENIVDDFLKHNPDFSLCRPADSINRQLIDSRGFFHTYPHRHNMDGFFGAILKN